MSDVAAAASAIARPPICAAMVDDTPVKTKPAALEPPKPSSSSDYSSIDCKNCCRACTLQVYAELGGSFETKGCESARCPAMIWRTRAAAIFKRDTTHSGRKLSDAATVTTRKQVIWEAPNLSSARPRILIEVKNLLDRTHPAKI
jgi:hypothetical protein